jgi:Tol biopolymer transport system component
LPDRYEYSVAFSPDLTECVFGLTDSDWAWFTLLYSKMDEQGRWSEPAPAPFLAGGDGLSPAYTHDGETLYFASMRPSYPPANLWRVSRNGSGGWTEPEMVPEPVSTSSDEFAPSLDAAGDLYFVSGRPGGLGAADIYLATRDKAGVVSVENVGAPINSPHLDSTPFIAPDGSYLIFESDRPGGFGQQDLYVSFRRGGRWSAPENLGPAINTEQIEDEAYVTPDGKYLFFNRREAFRTERQTDLYWVELDAVLASTASGPAKPSPDPQSQTPSD